MTVSREVRLVARPDGEPVPSDFELAEVPVAEPGEGEVVVRNDWISVDPYMRGRMNDTKSYVPPFKLGEAMDGGAVGTVVASRAEAVPVGTTVLHGLGWREYATVDAGSVRAIDTTSASAEAYLGVLGLTGLTAYAGLTRIAPVKEGDVVFVSGAAGAVGSVAGQIARRLGASRVIGSAGGPQKAARLTGDFGYDVAIDYKEGRLEERLREAAPDGIDVYFDNVGGDHLRAALAALRLHGRVALCGAVAQYNAAGPVPGPDNLALAIGKRLTLRGFIASDHADLMPELAGFAASIRTEATVVDGIENAADAFLGLLRGANTGKMLVRL
ncbi:MULTISPECIES: NADP-dependent oxidoreductase [Thermomonosporaceae]|uniref:NADP-dependent oxidoreductase n=1 Tax=Thermomonosporaceae TaxID=2012 RepID=UPI00255AE744|nr:MULTISPECIES: NADP-dependent oxidoreductase [Thermomonosporaceae]MDL4777793.1 NADP-dependent oxidoreductase [Actinomadura xylanilytica]